MDRFKELTTFVEVAQRGSLSAAAREEGITPAMVGRRIDQLEERLGVKLFKRSTRKVTLTPEGTTFYEDCNRLLGELRSAEDALSVGAKSASGRLILTAPTAFGRKHIAPHLSAFIAEHPNLSITLHLSERLVDLKNERFDLAIRIADLKSADLIAAKLARNHRVVCGSPAYFKRAGKPKVLAELARHNCLVTSTEDGVADSWSFIDKGKPISVKVTGNLQCNDGEVLTRWAIAGEGLAWRSAWEVSEEVKRGRLAT
ncbi:MAG TPA: LysR family transcriptional regulator, partial [Usitatibacter sp.]|nr:LysR family transcriptional regulator [Usitatibacter sp.]